MRRMLIVEDDRDIREVLTIIVERSGVATVTAVATAEEALPYIRAHDILCTDFKLGSGMNGLQLAERFKRDRPWAHVILLTGCQISNTPYVDQLVRKPAWPDMIHLAAVTAVRKQESAATVFFRASEAIRQAQEAVARSRSLLSRDAILLRDGHTA